MGHHIQPREPVSMAGRKRTRAIRPGKGARLLNIWHLRSGLIVARQPASVPDSDAKVC